MEFLTQEQLKIYIDSKPIAVKKAFESRFIRYMPQNLDYGVLNNYSKRSLAVCNWMDYVDFHYRQYVIGFAKSLHRVFFEVREYNSLEIKLPGAVEEIIENVERDIGQNELYELMPRHLYAKKQVLELFAQLTKKAQGIA